jgi:hypothetical protein
VTDVALDKLFRTDYAADRAAFYAALSDFGERTGRSFQLHTHALDHYRDLRVSAAEWIAPNPDRLCIVNTGIHGIEGYAGSAIMRHALAELLPRLDLDHTSLLLVHALNPFGFERFVRVNADNVDLNRNCCAPDEALFATDSAAFKALASALTPRGSARVGGPQRARFYATILFNYARRGPRTLRQATLGGQYADPQGIFFGGQKLASEIAFFQRLFTRLAAQHAETLLVDLHTGYGLRGEAYPLFGQADSAEIRALSELGVSDQSGRDRTYTVHGDLIGCCQKIAKRVRPNGVFNGLVIELGTHGLTVQDQLRDLYAVVLENQLRNQGVADEATARHVRHEFRELFYPDDPVWQARAVSVGTRAIEDLLAARGFIAAPL